MIIIPFRRHPCILHLQYRTSACHHNQNSFYHRRFPNIRFYLRGISVRGDTVAFANGEYCSFDNGRSNNSISCHAQPTVPHQKRRAWSSSSSSVLVSITDGELTPSWGSSTFSNQIIRGRLIRKNTQRDTLDSANGASIILDQKINHAITQRHPHNNDPPQVIREHQYQRVQKSNIPVHSLGSSTLSATDTYRWRNNQRREKEMEKYRQLQAADQSFTELKTMARNRDPDNNHHRGRSGSVVALQSATVKYRQIRQKQRHQQVRKNRAGSEMTQQGLELHLHDEISHQLKSNPSARKIPLLSKPSNDVSPINHSTEPVSDDSSDWFASWSWWGRNK